MPPPSARQLLSLSWALRQSLVTASRKAAAGWESISLLCQF